MIWNIIDKRKRPYRWAKVHAIIEAAWHDNSVADADQAPGTTMETEVTFEEREDVSVNDAVAWAHADACPVTLYDGDQVEQPPKSEIAAAAHVLDAFGRVRGWWPADAPKYEALAPADRLEFDHLVQMLTAAAKARSEHSA